MKNSPTLPEDFVKRITDRLGEDSPVFFHSIKTTPAVSIRLHPLKMTDKFEGAKHIPWCEHGRYLEQRPVFTLDPLFHAGAYYVQEAGSMLIEGLLKQVIDELQEPLVLDLCAAPGGKSTHLLSMMKGKGVLVSNETIASRNLILRENLIKWGYANTIVTQQEAASIAGSGINFDIILVDAPCSGEGLFRKQPTAVLEWSPAQVHHCSQRQTRILDDILPALREGGYLLYSTCTFEDSENDSQVNRLIEEYGLECITPAPPEGIESTAYGWQAWPHRVNAEGFYCTLLKKKGQHSRKIFHQNRKHTAKAPSSFRELLKEPDAFDLVLRDEFIHAYTDIVADCVSKLAAAGYVRNAGLLMGRVKGKDFVPDIALALSVDFKNKGPVLQLERNDALSYLKGGGMDRESSHDGWHLVAYEKHPLGWAKKAGRRWNNYYPKGWRIRMDTGLEI